MGNWNINIQGVGAHHNPENEHDADRMTQTFVEALKTAGHTVEAANFTHGGKVDVLAKIAAKAAGATLSVAMLSAFLARPATATDFKPGTAHQTAVALMKPTAPIVAWADLPVGASIGDGGSADKYCQATPGSHGLPASITHSGSLDLADEAFGLVCNNLPPTPESWGMFTYGQVPTETPFANGWLCISPFNPGIYRMRPQHLGDTGTVGNSMLHSWDDFVQFQPGESWYFQFWYRDPAAGGAKFNLSDGLHVVFAPGL